MKGLTSSVVVTAALLASGLATAGQPEPAQNVGKHRPNLMVAQRLCVQAFNRITAAQGANEYDLAGHAAKAKALLEQVNVELKEAANDPRGAGRGARECRM